MSFFERLRSFAEDTDILADDFEAEFDNIAEALNGLFEVGTISASGSLAVTSVTQDIPGAEITLKPAIPSKLIVLANFDVNFFTSGNGLLVFAGNLKLDGAAQPRATFWRPHLGGSEQEGRNNISQAYAISLSAGSHTVKLVAQNASEVFAQSRVEPTSTGFIYLLIPDPNP